MGKPLDWMYHKEYLAFLVSKLPPSEELTTFQIKLVLKMTYFNPDKFYEGVLCHLYKADGRPAIKQAQILRACFLFVGLAGRGDCECSLSYFVNVSLPENRVLQILCGFESREDIPKLPSFYDFIDRLWAGDLERYSRHAHYPLAMNWKSTNPYTVGPDNKVVDKLYSVNTLANLSATDERLSGNDDRYHQQLLALMAVIPSMEYGLLGEGVATSMDSTALPEHASPYRTCSMKHDRFCPHRQSCGTCGHFSAPDSHLGYDSGTKESFHGQHVHIFVGHDLKNHATLPICFTFADAQRHDSIVYFTLRQEAIRNVPDLRPGFFDGDSAYDHTPIYQMTLGDGMIPLIQLNTHNLSYEGLPKDIQMDTSGHPWCKAGRHEMVFVGNDEERQCWIYRCPERIGEGIGCPKASECHWCKGQEDLVIDPKDSVRFFTAIPRDSEDFKEGMCSRSGSERMNNRLLHDYPMNLFQLRNVPHRSFLSAFVFIHVHQDCWIKHMLPPQDEDSRRVFNQYFPEYVARREEQTKNQKDKQGEPVPAFLPFQKSYPPVHPTQKSLDEMYARNALERTEDEELRKKQKEALAAIRKEYGKYTKEHPEILACPREVAEERKKSGKGVFEDPIPPFVPSVKIPPRPNEEFFIKSWERTYYDYIAPSVIIDLDGNTPVPPETVVMHGQVYTIYVPESKKGAPKVWKGYTKVDDHTWKKEAQSPVDLPEPRVLPAPEFNKAEFTNPSYSPPPFPWAGVKDKKADSKKDDTSGLAPSCTPEDPSEPAVPIPAGEEPMTAQDTNGTGEPSLGVLASSASSPPEEEAASIGDLEPPVTDARELPCNPEGLPEPSVSIPVREEPMTAQDTKGTGEPTLGVLPVSSPLEEETASIGDLEPPITDARELPCNPEDSPEPSIPIPVREEPLTAQDTKGTGEPTLGVLAASSPPEEEAACIGNPEPPDAVVRNPCFCLVPAHRPKRRDRKKRPPIAMPSRS